MSTIIYLSRCQLRDWYIRAGRWLPVWPASLRKISIYLPIYLGAGYTTDIYGQAVAARLTSELEGDIYIFIYLSIYLSRCRLRDWYKWAGRGRQPHQRTRGRHISIYLGAGYATDIYGQAVTASLTSELEGDIYLSRCRLRDWYLSIYPGAGYATDIYGQAVAASLTSELEGDKMVLKICKPPRDKDSMVALTWQCCTWVVAVSFPAFVKARLFYN